MRDYTKKPTSMERPLRLVVTARMRTYRAIIQDLPVTFRYDPEDPFAVRLEFGDPESGSQSWLIGREQLLEGLLNGLSVGPIAIREVTVSSAGGGPQPSVLRLTLRVVGACAAFEMEADAVRSWLADTFSFVAPGTEGSALDWDAFLVQAARELDF